MPLQNILRTSRKYSVNCKTNRVRIITYNIYDYECICAYIVWKTARYRLSAFRWHSDDVECIYVYGVVYGGA